MKISTTDLKRSKDLLTLDVTAIASTFGWTNVVLSKAEYVTPPEDGLQDIILSATAPAGPAATAVEVFQLSVSFNIPVWFQGVRISNHAGNESRVLRSPVANHFPIGNSGFSLDPLGIDGDKLLLNVGYGGGCKKHSFQLNWDGMVMESFPPKVKLDLSHNDHGDNCRALMSETLQFDLSVLYGFPTSTVDLLIVTPGGTTTIRYTPSAKNNKGDALVSSTGDFTMTGRIIKRGYSNNWDLAEAMRDAIRQLPDRSAGTIDYLATFILKQTGAETGGIAGLNRLFVDVEG